MNNNDTTTVVIILIALVASVVLLRAVARIVSWRIVLPVLLVAVLVALGLLDIDPILSETSYLLDNLFGGTP